MNLRDWTLEQLQTRRAEIAQLVDTAADADLDALETETRAIAEELERRADAEARRQNIRSAVANSTVPTMPVAAAPQAPVQRSMEDIRGTREYAQAYLDAIRTGSRTEVRALLTEFADNGYIPVPTALENEIKTAWENTELLSLVKHSAFKGNVKVGFELTATGAVVHAEGTEAPEEEEITLGTVVITNEVIKKWITVSDEGLEGTTVDTAGYLYKEIAQKIAEKAEEEIVARIVAAPAVADATHAAVPVHKASTLAIDTVTMAVAELSGQARNLVLAMNRRTYAALKATAKKANYSVDPFDGIRVVFTDKLKAFSAASADETYMIAGDFGYGFQANFPNGYGIEILKDPYSLAEKDLVKLVGKQYVGLAVVANNALVKVTK